MPTFKFVDYYEIGVHYEIEAKTKEEAITAARKVVNHDVPEKAVWVSTFLEINNDTVEVAHD